MRSKAQKTGVATSWLWNIFLAIFFRGLTPPGYRMPPLRGYENAFDGSEGYGIEALL
jgi:hypothetical protein